MAESDFRRVILSFGPSGSARTDQVVETLPRNLCHVSVIPGGDREVPSRLAPYALLRLGGETLIAIETKAPAIEEPVCALRECGFQEFFALTPEFHPQGERDVCDQDLKNLRRRTVLARLNEHKRAIDTAHAELTQSERIGRPVTETARWTLDNHWLVEAAVSRLRRDLPPNISPASGSQKSEIALLARNLAATTDFSLSERNIREHLRRSLVSHPLTSAELWAFPLFLRFVLVEALARLATLESRTQQLRERARLWANRLAHAVRTGTDAYAMILGHLDSEPAANRTDFVALLGRQLQDEEDALRGLSCWTRKRFGTALSDLLEAERSRESAREISTGNAFTSLRTLGHLDYQEIFEAVSGVEAELRTDPGGVYPGSDTQTRSRCRHEVERIARESPCTEQEVARLATRLAAQSQAAEPNAPGKGNVLWHLLADGITNVEKLAGARASSGVRIRRFAVRHATPVYLSAILVLTGCFMALSVVLAREAGVRSWIVLAILALLASFTLSELSLEIAHALIISLLPPEPLPKMDYRDGIPEEATTLVVVPTMLTSHKALRKEIGKLEVRYLGNRNENIFFSLFSDFTDSAVPADSGDDALLRAAVDGINDLNARYPGGRFLLFHRPRTWSESEQAWIGRERKRGKIEDLNAFLCGDDSLKILAAGHLPRAIAYVLTLDSDTQLPPDSARRLIETIAHPLNRVEIDPATRVRKSGYTIIQPRTSIALKAATATRFTSIFADAFGADPYSQTVSDAQQDLLLEGIFHGKAIYDVKAFHTILKNRFPPESILSHDLIEGAFAGVGLASDIELFENIPTGYGSYVARQRRWIRGDWQIAPWMFSRVPLAGSGTGPTPLSIINRWRILDNLRRSLIPVAALALLLFGWLISRAPGVASLVVGLAVAIPALAPLLDRLARRVHGSVRGWQGAANDLKRAAIMISFLPHQAWLSLDSITRVWWRRWFSHRRMLEWQTAERAIALGRQHLGAVLRQMLVISLLSIVLTVLLVAKGAWLPAIAFVALWIVAPLLMRWLDRPTSRKRASLPQHEKLFLRRTARRTWRYFDDFVGEESNWLPPDNLQLKLRAALAQRTSPTNIGLWLVSSLAAHDFGYQTVDQLTARCSRTIQTLRRMERCDTHLLNWYDTRTLTPLHPRYVSTVDSGNLVAALWTFAEGCRDALREPVIGRAALRGLSDTLAVFQEACGDRPADAPRELRSLLSTAPKGHDLVARLRSASTFFASLRSQRWHGAPGDERSYWASRLSEQLAAWNETARRYLSWMETLAALPDSVAREIGPGIVRLRRRALRRIPSLEALGNGTSVCVDSILAFRSLPDLSSETAAWLNRLAAEYSSAQTNALRTVEQIQALRADAQDLSASMDFRHFYDEDRRLFGIGFSDSGAKAFTSYYDLLASECRLTSLVAIAKGDIPAEHWFAMSRPWAHAWRHGTLLSWSGTMFEYLMPLLFTRTFSNSLLHRACVSAVRRQIDYGERNAVPWGLSESAHGVIDADCVYQYRAFGVPELALNPEIGNDLVIAPYATVLALPMAHREAVANLHRLEKIGMAGSMGFYESIDFRDEHKNGPRKSGPRSSATHQANRGSARPRPEVICCYMAHHQAMSLAALNNLLNRRVLQRRFHRDPRIRSVEPLLCERVPMLPIPAKERWLLQVPALLKSGFVLNQERFAASPAISD